MYNAATDGISRRQTQIDIAHTLGLHDDRHRRRPDRPALLANLARTTRLDGGARRTNIVGAALRGRGAAGTTWHAEQNNFKFFNDPATRSSRACTGSTGSSRNTDPSARVLRAGHLPLLRRPGPLPGPGRRRRPVATSPFGWSGRRTTHRILAWHVKDGTRLVPQPPARRTRSRRRSCARTSPLTATRRLYRARARSARATRSTRTRPSSASSGSSTRSARRARASTIIESDSATRPARRDPGRSLRHAKLSLREPARAARRREGHRARSTVADEASLRERLRRGSPADAAACAPSRSRASRRPWAPRRRRTGTAIRRRTTSRRTSCTRPSPSRPSQALELQLLGLLQAGGATATRSRSRSSAARTTWPTRPGCSGTRSATPSPLVGELEAGAAGHGAAARGHAERPRGRGAGDARTRSTGRSTRAGAPGAARPARRSGGRRDGDALARTAIAAVRRDRARRRAIALPRRRRRPRRRSRPGRRARPAGGSSPPAGCRSRCSPRCSCSRGSRSSCACAPPGAADIPSPPETGGHHAEHRSHRAHHRPRHRPRSSWGRSGCRRRVARSARACASSRTR